MTNTALFWPKPKNIEKASNFLIEIKAFGFFDGGCLIFAEAIKYLIPSCQVVTILRRKQPDHYGVFIKDNQWGDASGLYENRYLWAQKYSILERVSGKLSIVKDLVPSNQIPEDDETSQKIAEILAS
jgi:hypothetical protein